MSADLAAVLGTIVLIAVGVIRYQHVDNTKTRDLIDRNRDLIDKTSRENRELIEKKSDENRDLIKENRELIEKKSDENRDLIEKKSDENRDLIDRNRDLIEKYHTETAASLGEVRERLARIEGRLEIGPPPPSGDAAAEAA
jgi:hypothetical protein